MFDKFVSRFYGKDGLTEEEIIAIGIILNRLISLKGVGAGKQSELEWLDRIEIILLKLGEESAKRIINYTWREIYISKDGSLYSTKQEVKIVKNLLSESIYSGSILFFDLFMKYGGDITKKLSNDWLISSLPSSELRMSDLHLFEESGKSLFNTKNIIFTRYEYMGVDLKVIFKIREPYIFNILFASSMDVFYERAKKYWFENIYKLDIAVLNELSSEKFSLICDELKTAFAQSGLDKKISVVREDEAVKVVKKV